MATVEVAIWTISTTFRPEDIKQISALLYCMGDEAEDTPASANVSEDNRKEYSRVITKFNAFFKVRKNIIFDRQGCCVPKSNENVQICIDLTMLNKNVQKEQHILPLVEQALAQIGGAKVFTKLDANSWFWQVELSYDSAGYISWVMSETEKYA